MSHFTTPTNSPPLSPTSSNNTFPPSPKRMLGKSPSGSGQVTLSPGELTALINKAVSEALAAQEAKRYTTAFPELPKLKSPPAVQSSAPDIRKSFVPKLPYFDGNKKEFLSWWRQLALHLGGYQQTPSDMQKIMITLSLMKGRLAERFTNMFVDSHNLEEYSFKEFKRNLSVTFQPANIRRKAEQELAGLRQKSNEVIEEFILCFHQCIIEAQYNTGAHGRFLIQILRNAVKQELVEFIEISQVQLINSDKLDDWVHALIQAERIKTKQKAWKATSTGHSDASAKSWNVNPRNGSNYVSPNYKGKNPITNFSANKAVASPATKPAVPAAIHPNQIGTFRGQGAPMDISKARAEGKCVKCSKPWPCKDHIRKHVIRQMTFRGQQINYTTADKLAAEISCIEKDFPTGEQI